MGKLTIFQEQLRNPDSAIRVQVDPRDTVAGSIAIGLDQVAQTGQRAADISARRDLAQQQAVRTQQLSDTRMRALTDLTDLRMKYAADPDPATMRDRWKADSDTLLKKYQEGLGDDQGLREAFTTDFEEWRLRDKVEIAGTATTAIQKKGRAALDAGLDTLSGMMAQTTDPIRSQQIQDTAKLSLQDGVTSGYLDPVDAGELERKFLGRADEARVRGLLIDNPEGALQALKDPKAFPGLDEVKRTTLTDMATRRVDSARSDRVRLLEHADRVADRELAKQGEAAAKDLWGKEADGSLSRDDIEAQRSTLDKSDYRALLSTLKGDATAEDDVSTVADLTNRVGSEDIASDATEAFKAKLIKKDTFTSLIEKNRTLRAGNAPDTPYRSGRDLVSTTLDPGQLLSGPAASIARAGRAQAVVEFDNWAAAHPEASRADAQSEAQRTIKRYQVINYDSMAMATGLPRNTTATRETMTAADLDKATVDIADDLDANRITKEQADQELRKIDTWRGILAQKPITTKAP